MDDYSCGGSTDAGIENVVVQQSVEVWMLV